MTNRETMQEKSLDTETRATNTVATRAPMGEPLGTSPLAMAAIAALRAAATVVPDEQMRLLEERNTWQPDSWLIQCCWERLAETANGSEALAVAARLAERQPLAPLQALYQLARRLPDRPALGPLLEHSLQQWQYRLFHTHREEANDIERLLLVATTAALAGDHTLAAACLERLDNVAKSWERVVSHPALRDQLALCIVHIGPHPLVNDLINIAIRRFDDAGAQFLYAITTLLTEELAQSHPDAADLPAADENTADDNSADENTADDNSADENTAADGTKAARLLQHCLDTLRLSTLVTLHSRRVAAMIFAQAGQVDEVLTQVATIERVQSAQRETGFGAQKDDPKVLRQVKRPNANSDVDFLVYTLRNAIELMPQPRLRREERIALSDQLALWGIRSDGWTAASAAGTLVSLGALRYAVEVVDHVPPNDPARSECLLMLVRALMALGEEEMAAAQTTRALQWAESLAIRNPERALMWGLAEIYLQHQRPQIALQLLDRWREPTGWRQQLRKLRGDAVDDDGLRNRRLRLQALLQLAAATPTDAEADEAPSAAAIHLLPEPATVTAEREAHEPAKEIPALLRTLRRAAPRLLEGEALIHFYIDGLLRPLLRADALQEAWALLPDLGSALVATSGQKHAMRVREIAQLLEDELRQRGTILQTSGGVANNAPLSRDETRGVVEGFLRELWQASAAKGTWQTIHSIEGTLSLLLALEGPAALVAIAETVDATFP